jgi:molecular chaperone DnaK
VDVHVLQGERPMAADNMSLGRFRLEGIPAAPRGMPQVEVTFDIDANGILNVAARDRATGREQNVTITASTNLNKTEIERMVQQARQNETDDRKRRELVEARNNADSLAYQTEKTLKDLGDKVPANEQQNIQSKIEALRETAQGNDNNQIKRQSEELQNAFYALSQQLYAQQQPASNPEATYAGGNNGGNSRGNGGQSYDSHPTDEGEVIEGEFHPA